MRFAITTSVAVHVLVLLFFAWLMGLGSSARLLLQQQMAVKEVPVVTMIFPTQILPTPPKLPAQQFIRTSQNAPLAEKPAKSSFISDRNTKAASETAPFPDGDKAAPSSTGMKLPTVEVASSEFHDGKITPQSMAAKPAISPRVPAEPATPPPSPAKPPVETAKASTPKLAKMIEEMDKEASRLDTTKLPLEVKKAETAKTPAAEPKPSATSAPAEPPAPKPAMRTMEDFSPLVLKPAVKGTISNRGEASVDAEATPMGRFVNLVTNAVDKKWHEYQVKNAGSVSFGYLRVRFYVNRAGHVEQPEFLEKSNNPLMDDFTLDAILAADVPPIPQDLLPLLDDNRVPVEIGFIIN